MPRDGSNTYAPPGGTAATTLTPISSSAYNSFVADIAQDQNTARPVTAGGTGANNATDARTNLDVLATGDAVSRTGTETLTNKTLTSPTITTPTLTLKQGASEAPTAEGDIRWDSDDNRIVVGDGAATQTFTPNPASTAAGDIEYYTAGNTKARLAKGTAKQILRMNSGATAPEWSTESRPLGEGQTWQDVTGSRAAATSYQNTTGRAIFVSITAQIGGTARSVQVSADNSTWVDVATKDNNTTVWWSTIVPSGMYYRISGAVSSISLWSELR